MTCLVSMLNVVTSVCVSGYSSGTHGVEKVFGVSSEVGTLGLSTYLVAFAIGPMLLAPLSEYFGRSPVYLVSWFFLFIFQLPVALAPNIGTLLVCRFFHGLGGAVPLASTGGAISDLWKRNDSGNAMAVYTFSSTAGPPLGLVVSGYIALEKEWRWQFWVYMATTGGFWLIVIFTLPETRHSIILKKKAARVRKTLIEEGLDPAELIRDAHADEARSLHSTVGVALARPFHLLFTDPIAIGAAGYNGFVFGIVYLLNEAFPLVFGKGHGFNTGEWGLTGLGLIVGSVIGALLHLAFQEPHYLAKVRGNDGKGAPEARLWLSKIGIFLLPISLFWFAWTSFPSVPWIVPVLASGLLGVGIFTVVLAVLNYVVDSYQTYSASALAGIILVRNLVVAGFPLFASQMYNTLGYEWASSLSAFLSLLIIPIVWSWYYYGKRLRLSSSFVRVHLAQDEDAPH